MHNTHIRSPGRHADNPALLHAWGVGVTSHKMARIIVLLLVVGLAACSQTLDISLESEVDVFLSSDNNKKIRLTQQDEAYRELNEWLHKHRSEWYATSGRYPGGVYVKSGNHGIQITDSHVVIYSTTGPEARPMYIQELAKGELPNVKGIGK